MITKPTTFVLGAGASAHLDFPSGEQLLKEICEELKPKVKKIPTIGQEFYEVDDDSSLHSVLIKLDNTKEFISDFRKKLLKAEVYSIDSFLEIRTEYIKIGKIAILYVLLKYENKSVQINNPNWYKIIWSKIKTQNFEELKNNNVSFITYNYDRSLEYYLVNAMMALYNKTLEECLNLFVEDIPIIHVHGTFGESSTTNLKFLDYGKSDMIPDTYDLNSKSIKIVHEDIENDSVFQSAHTLLQNTSQIIFLGFGFNQTNIDRLNLSSSTAKKYGSCMGLTRNELEEIMLRNRDSPISLSYENTPFNCEEFIRENVQFV